MSDINTWKQLLEWLEMFCNQYFEQIGGLYTDEENLNNFYELL